MNFETALDGLETLIKKMETGQLSLEDSLKCFEEGIQLTRLCQQALKEAQQKVEILTSTQATSSTEPFILTDNNDKSS
jgi:exodeoxyribonuclease VII small subunit